MILDRDYRWVTSDETEDQQAAVYGVFGLGSLGDGFPFFTSSRSGICERCLGSCMNPEMITMGCNVSANLRIAAYCLRLQPGGEFKQTKEQASSIRTFSIYASVHTAYTRNTVNHIHIH